MAALKFIASACLAGVKCRYDGENKKVKEIYLRVKKGKVLPLCPEQLAGLPTPRKPSQTRIKRGKVWVISSEGKDLTGFFSRGANLAFRISKRFKIESAYLKKRSPSCGFGQDVRENRIPGMTAALFDKKRMRIYSR